MLRNWPAKLQSLWNFSMTLYSDEALSSHYSKILRLSNPGMKLNIAKKFFWTKHNSYNTISCSESTTLQSKMAEYNFQFKQINL